MNLKGSKFLRPISLVFAFALTLILFLSVSGQKPDKPQKLSKNKPIARSIKSGETHIFRVKLKKGEYARAEVEQKNIDAVVSLFDAKGKLFVEMDGKDGRLWREAVSAIAKSGKAVFQIKIRAYGESGQVGDYTIRLAEVRPANAKDGKRLEAEQHLSNGRTFYTQRKLKEAGDEFEIATALFRELGDSEQEAISLTNVGLVFYYLSKYEQSVAINAQALELFQTINDRFGEGITANMLGINFMKIDQLDKARQFLDKALAIRREIKDRKGEGITLYNLGNLQQNYLSKYDTAKQYYEQSLVVFRDTKDRPSEGRTLNNLGVVYDKLSDYEKAKFYYEHALIISREVEDRIEEVKTLSNLGIVNYYSSDYEKAKFYCEQALVIYREIKNYVEEGKTLFVLGTVYADLSDYETAKDYYWQALIVYRILEDRTNEVKVYWDLSLVFQNLNNPKVEIFYGKQAINVYKGNMKESDKESRQSYLEGNSTHYQRLADTLISEGRLAEAKAVSALFKELESDRSENAELIPYSKAEAETIAKFNKLVELRRRKSEFEKDKVSLSAPEQKELDGIQSDIASANKAFRESLEKL